ncbi:hypothetical protein [Garciella nitratireducens]|uniref:hypothetical protein n=1 Tax=Garciella nitratireducens TaxID=218205 RepID=UPI001BD64A97|nr:hypothetical protein [Garciella nitratireducens]
MRKYKIIFMVILIFINSSLLRVLAFEPIIETSQTNDISFPSNIQVIGYHAEKQTVYLNYMLETAKNVNSSEKVTFFYVIEILNGADILIGNQGSFENPEQTTGSLGESSVSLQNQAIELTTNLPTSYYLIITVIETTIS